MSKGTYYLVTIKHNKKLFTSRKDIRDVYLGLVKQVKNGDWIDRTAFELDECGRLHLHTLVLINGKSPYFKALMRKNWHIHFKRIRSQDVNRVHSYINKNSHNIYTDEQMEWESLASFHSLFR